MVDFIERSCTASFPLEFVGTVSFFYTYYYCCFFFLFLYDCGILRLRIIYVRKNIIHTQTYVCELCKYNFNQTYRSTDILCYNVIHYSYANVACYNKLIFFILGFTTKKYLKKKWFSKKKSLVGLLLPLLIVF